MVKSTTMSNSAYKKLNIHLSKAISTDLALGKLTDIELSLLILLLSAETVYIPEDMQGHRHIGIGTNNNYFSFDYEYLSWFLYGKTSNNTIKSSDFYNTIENLKDKLQKDIFKDITIFEIFTFESKTRVTVKFTQAFRDKYMNSTAGNYFVVQVASFMKLKKKAKILYLYLSIYNNEETKAFKEYGYCEVFFTPNRIAEMFDCVNTRKNKVLEMLKDALNELQTIFPCVTVIAASKGKDGRKTTMYFVRWMPKSKIVANKLDKVYVRNFLQLDKENVKRRQTRDVKIKTTRAEKYKKEKELSKITLSENEQQIEVDTSTTVNEEVQKLNDLYTPKTIELEKENQALREENAKLQQLVEIVEQQKEMIQELQKQIQDIKYSNVVTNNTEIVETGEDINTIVEEALEKQRNELAEVVTPIVQERDNLQEELDKLQAYNIQLESLLHEKHIPISAYHSQSKIDYVFQLYKELTKTYGSKVTA